MSYGKEMSIDSLNTAIWETKYKLREICDELCLNGKQYHEAIEAFGALHMRKAQRAARRAVEAAQNFLCIYRRQIQIANDILEIDIENDEELFRRLAEEYIGVFDTWRFKCDLDRVQHERSKVARFVMLLIELEDEKSAALGEDVLILKG